MGAGALLEQFLERDFAVGQAVEVDRSYAGFKQFAALDIILDHVDAIERDWSPFLKVYYGEFAIRWASAKDRLVIIEA